MRNGGNDVVMIIMMAKINCSSGQFDVLVPMINDDYRFPRCGFV
jgi:hypothetical protein